jgi:hypothetical protein
MSSIDLPRRSRSRRRLAAWAAFGVAGLAAGAVWATGFATVSGSGTNATSPALTRTAPADQADRLAGTAIAGTDPVYNFEGFQGSVAKTSVYTIDLTGQPNTETFNVEVLLATAAQLTGWSTIQLEWDMVTAAGATCSAAADFTGSTYTAPKVMHFDSQDARVGWNGVAGGAKYCIGLRDSDGRDINGTFLQSASETAAPSVYPSFIATVDRATS